MEGAVFTKSIADVHIDEDGIVFVRMAGPGGFSISTTIDALRRSMERARIALAAYELRKTA